MTLNLIIDGKQRRIELQSGAPQCRFRLDGGGSLDAEVQSPEPGVYSVLMEGRVYDARIETAADGVVVTIDGYRFEIQARDPRRWMRGAVAGGTHAVAAIKAPMPGKVVRVLAAAGDMVEAGQGILVVEAMKMQNEMKSPRSGRIGALLVAEGATVAAGETLVTIE